MQNKNSFLASPEVLDQYLAQRDAAIDYALEASVAAYPALVQQFGQRGREACAEDIGYHLDFLRPTLETGELSPFISYLGWLSQVLSSRGVPLDSLPRSLDDLAAFFSRVLGDAATPVVAALVAGREALAAGISAPTYDNPCPAPWQEADAFCNAALSGNRREALALFTSALQREKSLAEAAVHVIQPALYAVGRRWQENGVSVAQEHMATALAQTVMAQSFGRFDMAPDNGQRVVFACLAGNHHTIGLRMVADAFEFDGWTTYYLGANTPLASLITQVREVRPQLIGLSASLPYHLRTLREAIAVLRTVFVDDCPRIAVGGLVFNQFPQLAKSIGAELLGGDACAAAAAAAPGRCAVAS